MHLTFQQVAEINAERCKRWHNEAVWTGADWSNAMNGEAGEAANVVKKLRRHETGAYLGVMDKDYGSLTLDLAHEIADTILYAFLLADHYGINVAAAVVDKFNLVSERQGFPERLP